MRFSCAIGSSRSPANCEGGEPRSYGGRGSRCREPAESRDNERSSRMTRARLFAISTLVALWCATSATGAGSAELSVEQVSALLKSATPATPADLAGKDLSDLDLSKLDFRHAQLRGASFFASKLVLADFRGANLEGANFNGAW